MKRREFITGLGSAAAWPVVARAQQPGVPPGVPVIGFLGNESAGAATERVRAFRQGLNEAGFVEGRDVAIEFRWAEDHNDRLPSLAADLVRRRVAVIVAAGSTAAALAAKAATTTIPIVFQIGSDPVEVGLVASFNRPGGNATGIGSMNVELVGKRIELLHDLMPSAVRFAMLVNPVDPNAQALTRNGQQAAEAIGLQIEIFAVSTKFDIDMAFASLAQKRVDAIVVSPGPLFVDRRVQLVTLAVRHPIPAIYPYREMTEAGGLISYGVSLLDIFRQTGVYTGRILRGEKPSDLAVLQPTKFEFIVNMQTARTLGIEVPPTLLARADEVIE
jgi:putative ABC transport system substrate-binding protein